jgi:hypothetical protein
MEANEFWPYGDPLAAPVERRCAAILDGRRIWSGKGDVSFPVPNR